MHGRLTVRIVHVSGPHDGRLTVDWIGRTIRACVASPLTLHNFDFPASRRVPPRAQRMRVASAARGPAHSGTPGTFENSTDAIFFCMVRKNT